MTSSTFTIQPWTPSPPTPTTLSDVLARAQRGHLRDITESTLQEELAAEGALDLSSDNEESESESEEDGDAESDTKTVPFGKPSTREDLYAAKRYLLQTVAAARGEIAFAVDLTSLLVSKDLPRQAQATLGQEILQKKIPFGSVGVDFWQRMPVDEGREAQDRLLATNVKMEGLQKAADGLLGAAERMKETVRREGEYWEQVLRVSERGWKVCRVPGQGYRLGVRYGFSESARQFERRGIAALNPDRDGGISLDRGIGSQVKGLRVEVRRQGQVLGASKVPNIAEGEEATLEARIRHARDSLFDEELYHEMIRESRLMGALGVTVDGSTIKLHNPNADDDATSTISGKDDLEISFDLIPLDSTSSFPPAPTTSSQDDRLAQAALLTARLLLTQAHRDRLRKRSEMPAPLSDKQDDDTKPPLPILRPIMMVMLHRSALERVNEYIGTIDRALTAATIEHKVEHALLSPLEGEQAMTAEKLITAALLEPLKSSATLSLNPPSQTIEPPPLERDSSHTFTLAISTSLAHAFGPTYHLSLPKPQHPPPNDSQPDTFHFQDPTTFTAAADAALASHLASSVLRLAQAASQERDCWVLRADEGVVERDVGIGEQSQGFSVEVDGSEGEIRFGYEGKQGRGVVWKAADDDDGGRGKEEEGFFEVVRSCLG